MQAYLIPIKSAVLLFPILAALITLPYALHQYRKYGSIMMLRVAIVYSFVFYLLCAYFMVILPLPPIADVATYTNPVTQLQPLRFIQDLLLAYDSNPSLLDLLKNPIFFTTAFNILLCFPIGVYFRYYFNFSFKKTLLWTFLLSLSFELLQLSALFGIYPRPYRLFDVDDLIINTLGGCIGYGCAPLFSFFLPNRENLDLNAYHKGHNVTGGRRFLALCFDLLLTLGAGVFCFFCLKNTSASQNVVDVLAACSIAILLFDILIPILTHGQTIGKRVVKIKLVQKDHQRARWYQIVYHFGTLYFLFLAIPIYIYMIINSIFQSSTSILLVETLIIFLLVIIFFLMLFQSIGTLLTTKITPLYNKFWQLQNCSMIIQPEDTKEDVIYENASNIQSELQDELEKSKSIEAEENQSYLNK